MLDEESGDACWTQPLKSGTLTNAKFLFGNRPKSAALIAMNE